ncbi:hypothetical protein [Arthrobacter sp. B0490]|uniref:hypothetical protein n=1 Tax=Arthrobacter sp. B0490 TaxID=2058891 RepID=UPI000CE53BEC|nr:hypothetical protein [Arthrobacter sp. B0490]
MSLAPRILAAAGLLAVPALLAVGSQALSRPAEVPPVDPQPVVVNLAPAEAVEGRQTGDEGDPTTPRPEAPTAVPGTPSPVPATAPSAPQPAPPVPADQSAPGLVEREVLGDHGEDDDVDVDDEVPGRDGED